jgi:(E)-4-hydroxy-3-methylbut-2-enyl-diphosphate synthase
MKIARRKTRTVRLGGLPIGGGHPVVVQSMTKTDTRDPRATLRQIRGLAREGCEAVRCAVPDAEAARALGAIVRGAGIPVIADIHFDWRLAMEALAQGVHGLRLNPGNIGAEWKIAEVVAALRDRGVPVRIGVNAGSLEKDLLKKFGHPTAEALVASAERHIGILEKLGYGEIKVSLKASDVPSTVGAYRAFSRKHDYPLHIGISEAGPTFPGLVKSSVGLGILLSEGIGDTMRVSLTDRPAVEVRAAYEILGSLRIRRRGVEIVSCPTCGRCGVDLKGLVAEVQRKLRAIDEPITVAVMGCAVNGPGEAREADFGIASAKGEGIIFRKGKVVGRAPEGELAARLMAEIEGRGGRKK